MPGAASNLYERYQPIRRRVEVGFWIVLMTLLALFSIGVVLFDARKLGWSRPPWEIVTWEASSHLAWLLLVPAMVAFEGRFPLRQLPGLGRNLASHLLASVAFSAAHIALMVVLRHLVYALMGQSYVFGGSVGGWASALYEYTKDLRTYLAMTGGIVGYRLFMLRLQGEARLLDMPEAGPAAEAPSPPEAALPAEPAATRPERFLVRKLRREFLIAAADIDWLQAQGNYVGLHVNGHDYLLRATLTDFLGQLDPARFARVHRSYAVNLDRIREIEPVDAGDARLHMHDGTTVPCSRRYRDALKGGGVPA